MIMYAKSGSTIHIGRAGEHFATDVVFDIENWIKEYGVGTATLVVQQNGATYPQLTTQTANTVVWTVTKSNTHTAGGGKCELFYAKRNTDGEDIIVKSAMYDIIVTNALGDGEDEPPAAYESWVDEIAEKADYIISNIDATEEASQKAIESAAAAKVSETNSKTSETAAAQSAAEAASYRQEVAENAIRAESAATAAALSEQNAKTSEINSKTSENEAKNSENNALNSENAAELSAQEAKSSETNSKASENAAAASAQEALDSQNAAKDSETASKTSETNAKTSETNAKSSEEASALSELNAKTSETNAKASEVAAAASEEASALSELNAKTSETNAATSATNAASSASSASGSEADALAFKNAAATSASNAATSETKAKTSETNAKTAETGAVAAKTAAESAKSIAVTAKDNAVLAKTAAETAQGLAETAKLGADAAKSGADTAKAGAESARDTAITAKNDAVTAKTAAQTAQTAAETAKGQAETARAAAQESATTSENRALDSEAFGAGTRGGAAVIAGDPAYKNNAKWYKDQAGEIVGGDFSTKTEAQAYATTAETNANAYTDTQIAAIPPVDISGKADKTYVDNKVKTDVPVGAKFTDTVYTHPASHPASMITDLPTGKKVARFVIGTSAAGWTAADCDYLCDGTADQTEINAAISALPTAGGEIVILDGTYNITAKIDVNKNNVSIRGNGNATILKRMFDSSGPEGVITLIGRSGCKIADLQIEGNKTSYTSNRNYGIYLHNSNNSNTVAGNTCNNNNSSGIYLEDSINNAVTGNTCNNNSSGIDLEQSRNNTVAGNTCNNNNSSGIHLSTSSNTITGNACDTNDRGIYLYYSNSNTITGNACNNNNSGIYLTNSKNNAITGNIYIRGTGLAEEYTTSQHTIQLRGTGNSYNLISNNNCMGKAVTNEGGTGNSVYGNKYDSGDYKDFTQDEKTKLSGIAAGANKYTHPGSGTNPHGTTAADVKAVAITGNQTIAGIKTFSSFPISPSSAPTTDYQLANKKYVDDTVGNLLPDKIGDIKTTARTDLGENWLLCNGGVVKKEDYSDLCLLLGQEYIAYKISETNVFDSVKSIIYEPQRDRYVICGSKADKVVIAYSATGDITSWSINDQVYPSTNVTPATMIYDNVRDRYLIATNVVGASPRSIHILYASGDNLSLWNVGVSTATSTYVNIYAAQPYMIIDNINNRYVISLSYSVDGSGSSPNILYADVNNPATWTQLEHSGMTQYHNSSGIAHDTENNIYYLGSTATQSGNNRYYRLVRFKADTLESLGYLTVDTLPNDIPIEIIYDPEHKRLVAKCSTIVAYSDTDTISWTKIPSLGSSVSGLVYDIGNRRYISRSKFAEADNPDVWYDMNNTSGVSTCVTVGAPRDGYVYAGVDKYAKIEYMLPAITIEDSYVYIKAK